MNPKGLVLCVALAACSSNRIEGNAPPPQPTPLYPPTSLDPPPEIPSPDARDFGEDARILYKLVACVDTASLPSTMEQHVVKAHCDAIAPKIAAYRAKYVSLAKPFLKGLAPADLPTSVVYPFSGGDLATALTTYPDAQEITTLSLELAGDPRRVKGLRGEALDRSLRKLRGQLGELLGSEEYSRSETLKKTQRGDIPGELGFFLVGLAIHGFEPVRVKYFAVERDGSFRYLTGTEIADLDRTEAWHRKATWTPPDFSEAFANVEITFRVPGSKETRVHRHIAQNLNDESLRLHPGAIRHLEKKGKVAAMVKAASYLLWRDDFSLIRGYLVANAAFTISDSTGVPPKFATAAGLVQETYGSFTRSLLGASAAHNADMKKLWGSQPRRKLPMRYGYLSGGAAHLLVTRRR